MSELVVRTLELLAETKGGFVSAVKNIFNTRTMATLKISDLSIGDYVCYCDRVYKVYSIEESGLVRANNKSYSCPHIMKHIDYIDPIPITAAILEKNGWKRNEEDEYMEYYGDPTSCIAHTKGTYHYRLEVPEASVVCHFVHQLQNALRLAGVDKEIVMSKK